MQGHHQDTVSTYMEVLLAANGQSVMKCHIYVIYGILEGLCYSVQYSQ